MAAIVAALVWAAAGTGRASAETRGGSAPLYSGNGNKEYRYDSIGIEIKINKDTTFDVEERQVFDYKGVFRKGWRSIPLKKIDAVSDIEVMDGNSGKALVYSKKRLDKNSPDSWGKYTHYRKNGVQNIEWYYNLKDAKHEWIIKYKVHGGIGFFKDYDELYWNLFTDYTAPISKVDAYVYLPAPAQNIGELKASFYSSAGYDAGQNLRHSVSGDLRRFSYHARNIRPRQKLTIVASWPKGIIDRSAYWKDFLKLYFGYLASLAIAAASFLAGLLYWYFSEKYDKGRGVIVPQYEPPRDLRPAMAEVIVKEKATGRVWPATVVDLAVRGYVRIKEEKPYWADTVSALFCFLAFSAFAASGALIFAAGGFWGGIGFAAVAAIFYLLGLKGVGSPKKFFFPKNYRIEKLKPFEEDNNLKDYEKKFLEILFNGGEYFSTREMKKSAFLGRRKREFAMSLKDLKQSLYKETETDTGCFEVGVSAEKKKRIAFFAAFLLVLGLVYAGLLDLSNQFQVLLLSAAVSALLLYAFTKYEAKLSKEGHLMREYLLGFKMYLETAERYRMQNLTPDIFEKYLPYAMIFGVEKSWGKVFQALNASPPSWYVSSGFSGGAAGFSAPSFASSFSSSFSSSFASSSGGGGGFAGGRGGGGGGGAS